MRAMFVRRRQLAVVVVGALITLSSVLGAPSLAAPSSSGGSQAEAWGTNAAGQLGIGTVGETATWPTAVTVAGPHTVRSVSAGFSHGLALLSNGTVKAWGSNEFGQLGDGTETSRPIPGTVAGLSEVKAVAAGGNLSVALLHDGTLRTWGFNFSGQLGDGTTSNRSLPVRVEGLPGRVTAIAAGQNFVLALLANGTVMAWGDNFDGQLGQGQADSQPHPVPLAVRLPQRVTSIGAGSFHSLAVLADGSVSGWGLNVSGQLGIGDRVSPQPSPVAVLGLSGVRVKSVSGGFGHTLALLTNGRVKAWGSNAAGQLGDGTNTRQLTPVDVLGLTGVTAVSAGEDGSASNGHSLAITRGSVMAWGENNRGQLGIGGSGSVNRAQAVTTGLQPTRSISAGLAFSLAS
ncbi:Alpha-tubulin suppressor [Asanoa ishikariensis]|uniref:Alpha-tubulin suppressor n=2 Tax=Asanoa ishikariensis TaxID=137265 RepID=A0A1H3MT16_9ACTN|nr:Alpha-tubulin suppressor [Asanoa ishikariensis]